ncbi:4Fe-4S ferredoxin [Bacillus sp. V3-13]|uniref:SCP2 sterol-binding domain-containing protein n=1 Tax=Bacillus sp. V3-13 TaxID=2053728 RepID=UPI000C756DF2|nr:SCP2 sterol-binding domain-containing protein [Bacillus sp. V3-13]PLR78608.1 4Fe-4S ferredoxin [Bacillus sp. V3-13]
MNHNFNEHPSVQNYYLHKNQKNETSVLEASWLRDLCLQSGADDVGFVSIDRPELDDQRAEIKSLFPQVKTLICFVCKMNREPVRSPARSIANIEFHHVHDQITEVGHRIVRELESKGIRAMNEPMGFPMEVMREGKPWVISHKPIAVAAGLGKMGIHRNVIHPKFGNFIVLGTVVINVKVNEESKQIDYNPCLECKLCVAACPVGAIGADGHFNFSACFTHNYREFLGGFSDWVENLVESKNTKEYRSKVSEGETLSMWQSLSFGANYKAAYCMAVCPAGEDVIGTYIENRKQFVREIVNPLQKQEETVYVVRGSDAEEYVQRRFPHKKVKQVPSPLQPPSSVKALIFSMPHVFQRNQAKDLDATYHFTFSGKEELEAAIHIKDKKIEIESQLTGIPDVHVFADSETWLKFIRKEIHILNAVLTRKIKVKGDVRLLKSFARCFPS